MFFFFQTADLKICEIYIVGHILVEDLGLCINSTISLALQQSQRHVSVGLHCTYYASVRCFELIFFKFIIIKFSKEDIIPQPLN